MGAQSGGDAEHRAWHACDGPRDGRVAERERRVQRRRREEEGEAAEAQEGGDLGACLLRHIVALAPDRLLLTDCACPQITRHVAEIVSRQEFILKLARAMMMFGGPTHRLQAQIQATGKVLDTPLSCMYLPDMMLISFEDAATSTSNIKFIRQGSSLDIGKLQEAHNLYWKVCSCATSFIHD